MPNTIHGSLRRILIGKSFGGILGARDGLVSFKNDELTRGESSRVLHVALYVADVYFGIPPLPVVYLCLGRNFQAGKDVRNVSLIYLFPLLLLAIFTPCDPVLVSCMSLLGLVTLTL